MGGKSRRSDLEPLHLRQRVDQPVAAKPLFLQAHPNLKGKNAGVVVVEWFAGFEMAKIAPPATRAIVGPACKHRLVSYGGTTSRRLPLQPPNRRGPKWDLNDRRKSKMGGSRSSGSASASGETACSRRCISSRRSATGVTRRWLALFAELGRKKPHE